MKHVMSWFGRMGLFVGGLLGMTYQPTIAKAVQPDTGPRPARSRYQRKLVEYSPEVLDRPITRQVARAELRKAAFKARTIWLESEGRRNSAERRSRTSRRFWTVGYITAREMWKQARWTQILDRRDALSDKCRFWAAGWVTRSGRI